MNRGRGGGRGRGGRGGGAPGRGRGGAAAAGGPGGPPGPMKELPINQPPPLFDVRQIFSHLSCHHVAKTGDFFPPNYEVKAPAPLDDTEKILAQAQALIVKRFRESAYYYELPRQEFTAIPTLIGAGKNPRLSEAIARSGCAASIPSELLPKKLRKNMSKSEKKLKKMWDDFMAPEEVDLDAELVDGDGEEAEDKDDDADGEKKKDDDDDDDDNMADDDDIPEDEVEYEQRDDDDDMNDDRDDGDPDEATY